ncbi:MAG: hypothetical protein FWH47_01300 [Methanomassiliicoccaceae archaeon]|nr:hypothetical protein [Methanomassiliicoccaceae archaeon]
MHDMFGAESFGIHGSHFLIRKRTNDISRDAKTLVIDYELPTNVFSDIIQFDLIDSTSQEIMYHGSAKIKKNGLVEIEIPGDSTPIRKIIFEVYMSLKEIFHKHICHMDEYDEGADSLLKLEAGESEAEAVQKIAIQYVNKVPSYLEKLSSYLSYYGKQGDIGYTAEKEFYLLYIQARGEFLYGISFMESLARELGNNSKQYSNVMSKGIEMANILYSGSNDLNKIHMGWESNTLTAEIKKYTESSEKTNQEMKNANVRVKNLTYYVLAFAVVAVLTPFFATLKEYLPELSLAFDIILITSILLILALMVVYLYKDHKSNNLLAHNIEGSLRS